MFQTNPTKTNPTNPNSTKTNPTNPNPTNPNSTNPNNNSTNPNSNNNQNNTTKKEKVNKKNEISQFYFFFKSYGFLLIVTNIIFFINKYISETSLNIKTYNYNQYILYGFYFYIGILVMNIMTCETKYISTFIKIFIASIITVYISNWAVFKFFKKSKYEFWKQLILSFLISIGIFILFMGLIYLVIKSLDKNNNNIVSISDVIFFQFNYAFVSTQILFYFLIIFFPLCFTAFFFTNYNNKLLSYLNQNFIGFLMIFMLIFIIFWYATRIKLLNPKQYLNTFFTYLAITYVISVAQTYILMGSIENNCSGNSNVSDEKKSSSFAQLLSNLLIFGIIFILILNDIRKWSFMNYLGYILITIFILVCLFSFSNKYPSISLLSVYGFIEWCILNSNNSHDTGNSFHYVMMNNKYNLSSNNVEGTAKRI